MAIVDWPTSLGLPTVDGFSFGQSELIEQQETHRGAPRLRRRTTFRPTTINMSFLFSATQMEAFERYYWETLNAGTNESRITIFTPFGPQSIVMVVYPYSFQFDTILSAVRVSFNATYLPRPSSLFAAL